MQFQIKKINALVKKLNNLDDINDVMISDLVKLIIFIINAKDKIKKTLQNLHNLTDTLHELIILNHRIKVIEETRRLNFLINEIMDEFFKKIIFITLHEIDLFLLYNEAPLLLFKQVSKFKREKTFIYHLVENALSFKEDMYYIQKINILRYFLLYFAFFYKVHDLNYLNMMYKIIDFLHTKTFIGVHFDYNILRYVLEGVKTKNNSKILVYLKTKKYLNDQKLNKYIRNKNGYPVTIMNIYSNIFKFLNSHNFSYDVFCVLQKENYNYLITLPPWPKGSSNKKTTREKNLDLFFTCLVFGYNKIAIELIKYIRHDLKNIFTNTPIFIIDIFFISLFGDKVHMMGPCLMSYWDKNSDDRWDVFESIIEINNPIYDNFRTYYLNKLIRTIYEKLKPDYLILYTTEPYYELMSKNEKLRFQENFFQTLFIRTIETIEKIKRNSLNQQQQQQQKNEFEYVFNIFLHINEFMSKIEGEIVLEKIKFRVIIKRYKQLEYSNFILNGLVNEFEQKFIKINGSDTTKKIVTRMKKHLWDSFDFRMEYNIMEEEIISIPMAQDPDEDEMEMEIV